MLGRKVLSRQLEPVFNRARQRIPSLLPDVYAVRIHQSMVYLLIGGVLKYARRHRKCGYSMGRVFFSLVEIDKSFVISKRHRGS